MFWLKQILVRSKSQGFQYSLDFIWRDNLPAGESKRILCMNQDNRVYCWRREANCSFPKKVSSCKVATYQLWKMKSMSAQVKVLCEYPRRSRVTKRWLGTGNKCCTCFKSRRGRLQLTRWNGMSPQRKEEMTIDDCLRGSRRSHNQKEKPAKMLVEDQVRKSLIGSWLK